MLSSFAHPDRQHKAHFNSLVQCSGNPTPSVTDQIMFFHAGLLPFMKDKKATNPVTARFWTELDALQNYAINVHTHGTHKPAPIVPSSARTISSNKPNPMHKRLSVVQSSMISKGRGPPPKGTGQKPHGGASTLSAWRDNRAPAGLVEEQKRQLEAKLVQLNKLQASQGK